jgi:hypothetical protein
VKPVILYFSPHFCCLLVTCQTILLRISVLRALLSILISGKFIYMRITRSIKVDVGRPQHITGWTMVELSNLNRRFNKPHIMDHSTPKHLFRLIVSFPLPVTRHETIVCISAFMSPRLLFQDMYTGQFFLFRAILALWTIISIQFILTVFVSNARQ